MTGTVITLTSNCISHPGGEFPLFVIIYFCNIKNTFGKLALVSMSSPHAGNELWFAVEVSL